MGAPGNEHPCSEGCFQSEVGTQVGTMRAHPGGLVEGGCSQTGEWGDIINGGGSADTIGAQNGKKDFVHCGGGAGGDDHAWLDLEDELLEGHDCERVHRS